jgi:hypothetical protein
MQVDAFLLFFHCQLETSKEMEALRVHTAAISVVHKQAILKNMLKLYRYRIIQCQSKSIDEEIQLYPHLSEPIVVSFANFLFSYKLITIADFII